MKLLSFSSFSSFAALKPFSRSLTQTSFAFSTLQNPSNTHPTDKKSSSSGSSGDQPKFRKGKSDNTKRDFEWTEDFNKDKTPKEILKTLALRHYGLYNTLQQREDLKVEYGNLIFESFKEKFSEEEKDEFSRIFAELLERFTRRATGSKLAQDVCYQLHSEEKLAEAVVKRFVPEKLDASKPETWTQVNFLNRTFGSRILQLPFFFKSSEFANRVVKGYIEELKLLKNVDKISIPHPRITTESEIKVLENFFPSEGKPTVENLKGETSDEGPTTFELDFSWLSVFPGYFYNNRILHALQITPEVKADFIEVMCKDAEKAYKTRKLSSDMVAGIKTEIAIIKEANKGSQVEEKLNALNEDLKFLEQSAYQPSEKTHTEGKVGKKKNYNRGSNIRAEEFIQKFKQKNSETKQF